MLAFKVKVGDFFMIGEAVVRITESHNGQSHVAICAPENVIVHRMDKAGQPRNLFRKIVRRHTTDDGVPGAKLSCGHKIESPALTDLTINVKCPACHAHAARGTAMIQEHFQDLGTPASPPAHLTP